MTDTSKASPCSAAVLPTGASQVDSSATSLVASDASSADSSSTSLLLSAPSVEKLSPGESQKSAGLMTGGLSLAAPVHEPDLPALNTDAREIVGGISGDAADAEADHQLTDRGGQLDRVDRENDSKKRMDLSRLQKRLGPKHVALIEALKDVDPQSPHGQELASIIEKLK